MQLYSNTLRNWMKWKNFQENTNLPNYVQEKVKNRSISLNIFKLVKYILLSKFPGPGDFVSKFFQTFKVQVTSTSFKLFQITERDGNLSNSFYKFIIIFIPILDKNYTQETNNKKLQSNLIHEYKYKEFKLNISKLNIAISEKAIHHDEIEFRNGSTVQHQKIYYFNS